LTIIIHSFPFWLQQTQTWMYNQIKYMPEDLTCHIVCERTENLDQFAVANIHALRERSLLQYLWDKGSVKLHLRRHSGFLAERIRTVGADVVHSHFGHYAWRHMFACTKQGVPQVATFYGLDVNYVPTAFPRWRRRYLSLFDNVNRILCEGPHMASCVAALGCPEHKLQIHHLGIAVDSLPFKPRTWDGNSALRVLLSGSFREKKGLPYAIRALARLHRGVELDVTIIGDADESASSRAEKRQILSAIEAGRLTDRVRLLGYQPHATLLKEAYEHHLHMAPSVTAQDGDTEGGAPVSVIEMAATGMPVIASKHCDIPEVIEHNSSGLLAEERDVDGLVSCLQTLADQPSRWHAMATTARRHIEREFNAAQQGRKLAQLYKGMST